MLKLLAEKRGSVVCNSEDPFPSSSLVPLPGVAGSWQALRQSPLCPATEALRTSAAEGRPRARQTSAVGDGLIAVSASRLASTSGWQQLSRL